MLLAIVVVAKRFSHCFECANISAKLSVAVRTLFTDCCMQQMDVRIVRNVANNFLHLFVHMFLILYNCVRDTAHNCIINFILICNHQRVALLYYILYICMYISYRLIEK